MLLTLCLFFVLFTHSAITCGVLQGTSHCSTGCDVYQLQASVVLPEYIILQLERFNLFFWLWCY